MKVVDLTTDYEVSQGDVSVSITMGEGQIGSSVVILDQEEKDRGDITNLVIGDGPSIKNKPLFIKSTVTDVNDNTNHTSIEYVLKGGNRDQRFISSGTVEENGDSIIYRAKFNLV